LCVKLTCVRKTNGVSFREGEKPFKTGRRHIVSTGSTNLLDFSKHYLTIDLRKVKKMFSECQRKSKMSGFLQKLISPNSLWDESHDFTYAEYLFLSPFNCPPRSTSNI